MVSVELIHGDGNRKKNRKGENKQRHIKIRENKKTKNKKQTRKITTTTPATKEKQNK